MHVFAKNFAMNRFLTQIAIFKRRLKNTQEIDGQINEIESRGRCLSDIQIY